MNALKFTKKTTKNSSTTLPAPLRAKAQYMLYETACMIEDLERLAENSDYDSIGAYLVHNRFGFRLSYNEPENSYVCMFAIKEGIDGEMIVLATETDIVYVVVSSEFIFEKTISKTLSHALDEWGKATIKKCSEYPGNTN